MQRSFLCSIDKLIIVFVFGFSDMFGETEVFLDYMFALVCEVLQPRENTNVPLSCFC